LYLEPLQAVRSYTLADLLPPARLADWYTSDPDDPAAVDDMTDRDHAYALGKQKSERLLAQAAEESNGFETASILPFQVLGPLMCKNHDQHNSWQNRLGRMMSGEPFTHAPDGRVSNPCLLCHANAK